MTKLHAPMLFPLGAGYDVFTPGGYAYGAGVETRFGYFGAGPRLVADLSGVATGYVPIVSKGGRIIHNGVNWLITTNGTNTKVYRVETGAWALKETVNSAIATDMVSFKEASNTVLAIGYGSGTAYRYTVDNGSNWVASTKVANKFNYATVRTVNRNAPQVDYVVSPNSYYSTTVLTNGTESTLGATVGDANATDEAFTSLTEDDTGVILIGKTHWLFSLTSAQVAVKVTPYFESSVTEAGGDAYSGSLNRLNFENPVFGPDNAIYYHGPGGYEIIRYYHGDIWMVGPSAQGPNIPYMCFPVTAIGRAGPWMLCATGTSQFSTIRDFANELYGTGNMLHNASGGTTSGHLWVGKWDGASESVIWHGSIVASASYIRSIWFDDATSIMYIGYDNTTTSQVRCYYALTDPRRARSSITGSNKVTLAASAKLELGLIEGSDPSAWKSVRRLAFATSGLASSTPSLTAVLWPLNRTAAPAGATLSTFAPVLRNNDMASYGMPVPRNNWKRLYVELQLTNDTSTPAYGVVRDMDLDILEGTKVVRSGVL